MDDYAAKRAIYIQRLHRQSEGMTQILHINSLGLIPPETEDALEEYRRRAQKLLRKLETEEFEIAIVGMEKAGKSTFVNALMGANVLPTKEARCTYTATSIRYGAEDRAVVRFFDRDVFQRNFRKNLEIMGIPHAETLSFETLSLADYQSLYGQLDERTRKEYNKSIHQDMEDILTNKGSIQRYLGAGEKTFTGRDELESDEFQRFIINPGYAFAVEEIVIQTTQLEEMKNAVIYDVPGFNSPTEMHKVQTITKMRSCDAILYVARADEPSITREPAEIFETELDEDDLYLREKLFVFANKADRSGTLEENLGVLRKDLARFNILSQEHFSRIVAGSAMARLQAKGIVPGDNALRELERQGKKDGVDEIRHMLEAYNRTERVQVMQKRVDNLQRQIRQEFQALFEKTGAGPSCGGGNRRETIVIDLFTQAIHRIPAALEEFRSQLLERFRYPQTPLTDKLLTGLVEEITSQNLGVTDQELDRAIKHVDASSPNPVAVDRDLRPRKRQEIYDQFQRGILSLADQEHCECKEAILKIFAQGCRITEGNPHYETLMKELEAFVDRRRVTSAGEGYYNSLVYRFSDDLFQILLEYSFADDARYQFFEQEKTNFYSLAMFDKNSVADLSPAEQPLHRQLLFHDTVWGGAEDREELLDFLRKLTGGELPQETLDLVDQVLKTGADAAQKIRERLSKRTHYEANHLFNILEDMLPENGTAKTQKLSLEAYRRRFAGRPPKTYETVRQEINADIDVLHSVLKTALVYAIRLEKPFFELERGTIANLLDVLENQDGPNEFRDFILRNVHLIAAEDYRQVEQEEQTRLTWESIRRQIEEILNSMSTVKEE